MNVKPMNGKLLAGNKLLLLALLLVLAVKLYALAFLPETELVDAMFHLRQTGILRQTEEIDPGLLQIATPYYYLVVASMLSFLPLSLAFTKLVPLAVTLAYTALCWLFFKSLFGARSKLPFVLAVALPTFTIFGSINYTDPFAALVVLAAAHFFHRATRRPTPKHLLLAGFLVSLIPLTRINAALAFPPFFVGWLWLARRHFTLKKTLAWGFLFLFIALSWYGARILSEGCLTKGLFGCGGIPDFGKDLQGYKQIQGFGGRPDQVRLEKTERLPLPLTAFRASLDLWSFPPYSTLEALLGTGPTFLAASLFSLLTLGLTLLLLLGLARFLRSHDLALKIFAIAFLFNQYTTLHGIFLAGGLSEYGRLAMPTEFVAAAAIFSGFQALRHPLARKALKACLAVFIIYSLAYSAAFTFYFHGVYEKHAGLYAFVGTLPAQSNIFSSTRHQQIEFLTGIRSSGKEELFGKPMGYALVDSVLKAGGFTHLAWTCYKDLVPRPLVDQLEAGGRLKPIYSDSCTNVYAVNP